MAGNLSSIQTIRHLLLTLIQLFQPNNGFPGVTLWSLMHNACGYKPGKEQANVGAQLATCHYQNTHKLAPIMLLKLPIIPSRISQNYS